METLLWVMVLWWRSSKAISIQQTALAEMYGWISYHSEEAWLRTGPAHVHRFTSWRVQRRTLLCSKQGRLRGVMAGRVWENRKHGSRQNIEIEKSKACPSFLPTVPLSPSVVAHLRMRILLTWIHHRFRLVDRISMKARFGSGLLQAKGISTLIHDSTGPCKGCKERHVTANARK